MIDINISQWKESAAETADNAKYRFKLELLQPRIFILAGVVLVIYELLTSKVSAQYDSLPTGWKVVVLAGVVMIPVGHIVATYLANKVYVPSTQTVVKLGNKDGVAPDVLEIGWKISKQIEPVGHDSIPVEDHPHDPDQTVMIVRDIDFDEMTAKVTPPEYYDSIDLWHNPALAEENNRMLEQERAKWKDMKRRLPAIKRQIENNAISRTIMMVERVLKGEESVDELMRTRSKDNSKDANEKLLDDIKEKLHEQDEFDGIDGLDNEGGDSGEEAGDEE